MSTGLRHAARKQDSQIPDFEKDINTLIDCFYLQVQSGKPCDLTTFKSVWCWLHFGFVHQAVPGNLNAADHLQLLFSATLNRLDTCVPILAGAVAEAWQQSQAPGAWQPGAGGGQGQEGSPLAEQHATGQTQGQQEQHRQAEQRQQQEHETAEDSDDLVDHMQELDDLFAFLDHQEGADNPACDREPGATAREQPEQGPTADAAAAAAEPAASPSGRPAEAAAQQDPPPHIEHEQGSVSAAAQAGTDTGSPELPPLAVRIGGIYTLYCLYQTQTQSPRCNIYLPLVLLDLLTSMVPELQEAQALDALKLLQALWRDNAFLVGESRRPPSFLVGLSQHRQRRTQLTISAQLMENRAVRDGLFHMRSDLKALTDLKQLGQVTGEYARLRESIFQPPGSGLSPQLHPADQEHQHPCPSSPEEDPATSSRLPPMLFPAGFAHELQRSVEQELKRVQLSLLPQARPVHWRVRKRRKAAGGGAGGGVGAAEETAADRTAPEPFIGGVFGEILRHTKSRAAKRKAPSADEAGPSDAPDLDDAELLMLLGEEDLEGALEGLSGRAKAAVQRQVERQRLCSEVQGKWLSSHTRLMREEREREQRRRAGPSGDTAQQQQQQQQQPVPVLERAAAEPSQPRAVPAAAAVGDAACVVEPRSDQLGGSGALQSPCTAGSAASAGREWQDSGPEPEAAGGEVQASGEEAGHRQLQASRLQTTPAYSPHDLADDVMEDADPAGDADLAAEDADLEEEDADLEEEDADLAAELDKEFGDSEAAEEQQDEQDVSGAAGVGEGCNRDAAGAGTPDSQRPAQAQAQPAACTVVWCNGKPGVFGLADVYSVRCFCSECRGAETPRSRSWEPVAFVQHCGLKGKVWRQSMSVDEELQAQVAGRGGNDAHLAALLEGRVAGKRRGAKKLGDWLKEAEQQHGVATGAKGRRGSRKAAPRPAAALSPVPEAPDTQAPAPAAPPAPASCPMEVDEEYADILAQYDDYSRVIASVQNITDAAEDA